MNPLAKPILFGVGHLVNKSGVIEKKDREELSDFNKVIAYIKAWDRSHGEKYLIGMGQIRSRLIAKFLQTVKGLEELPKLEEQVNLVYTHFDEFKALLNDKHKDGILNTWLHESWKKPKPNKPTT